MARYVQSCPHFLRMIRGFRYHVYKTMFKIFWNSLNQKESIKRFLCFPNAFSRSDCKILDSVISLEGMVGSFWHWSDFFLTCWAHEMKVLWNTVRPFVCLFIGPLICLTVCQEFFSGTAHWNFLIFLQRLRVSSNLKSDRAWFFEKLLFWFFWTKRAQNEVLKFYKNWCVFHKTWKTLFWGIWAKRGPKLDF